MPNMYRGPQLNTYAASDLFSDSSAARLPVEGTVPRGYTPYNLPNSNEGYFASMENKQYPTHAPKVNENNLLEGERLYTRFCVNCHGAKGDGIGNLVKQEKFAGVPTYDSQRLPNLTPSSVFHVITYGKGVMGSHAAQIESQDRWRIVQHVMKLRAELDGTELNIAEASSNDGSDVVVIDDLEVVEENTEE
ncbi:MAG: cytochrome c [Cryomorphaceae bacterium]|nr:cytochrome c [Cryomorphaceae bacterium]